MVAACGPVHAEKDNSLEWLSPDADSLTMAECAALDSQVYVVEIDNLNAAFFEAWQQASDAYGNQHQNPMIDCLFQMVFDHYVARNLPKYIVLPTSVTVSWYNGEVKKLKGDDYMYADALWGRTYDSMLVARREYIPHITTEKPVLYLLPDYYNKLASYIGGVEVDNVFRKINRTRHSELSLYISAAYGHWGGYWHMQTMPIIYAIDVYRNGIVAYIRDSWDTGLDVFVPKEAVKRMCSPKVLCTPTSSDYKALSPQRECDFVVISEWIE